MSESRRVASVIRRYSLYAAFVGIGATTLLSVLAEFNSSAYGFNLVAQFRWQYLCLQFLSVVLLALHKRLGMALFGLLIAVINVSLVIPLSTLPNRETKLSTVKLRVVQLNANSRNLEFERIVIYLRNSSPDVFLVEELNPALTVKILHMLPEYRFNIANPSSNTHGIGLFSKIPILNGKIVNFAGDGRPGLSCSLDVAGHSVTFVGVHLATPVTQQGWDRQNSEFDCIASKCRRLPHPLILAGDFNSTSWTKRFQNLLTRLDLTDSRIGFGIQPTWPSDTPITKIPFTQTYQRLYLPVIHRMVMLPIDHFLITSELVILNRTIGPNVGSDHYPVLVDLSWKNHGRQTALGPVQPGCPSN